MPRTCTICAHAERAEIDKSLIAGDPLRNIAKRTGTSITALHRHRVHLPAHLAKAVEAKETAQAGSLLDQVRDLQAKTLAILWKAERAGDLRTATAAIGQARQNLELLGKMAGELRSELEVNLLDARGGIIIADGDEASYIAALRRMRGEPVLDPARNGQQPLKG